ncbi:MAG TPA: antitoxin Xre/MbcA/ParS toxin-binding domain-containing protein [Steroidobacteraceae bacterium]|jgi:putative toxin-antitoxin system antitoxin component (TIGR02293 family)|nr:antitoxin Xre/MbcA/ParS toxin-binding domain-containing protein [Steroidobacteraceae bacterium]
MAANAPIIDEVLGPLPDAKYPYRLAKLHELVGEGLPASVISRLEKTLHLTAPQSARILAVSETSRKRFKQTPRKRLDSAVSDRIMRVISTISEAVEIFGDRAKAIGWFKTLSPALGDLQPIDLMTSDPGAKLVRDELNRIRYGHWA